MPENVRRGRAASWLADLNCLVVLGIAVCDFQDPTRPVPLAAVCQSISSSLNPAVATAPAPAAQQLRRKYRRSDNNTCSRDDRRIEVDSMFSGCWIGKYPPKFDILDILEGPPCGIRGIRVVRKRKRHNRLIRLTAHGPSWAVPSFRPGPSPVPPVLSQAWSHPGARLVPSRARLVPAPGY